MKKIMDAINDFLRAMRGENKGGKWGVVVFLLAVFIILGFVFGTCQNASAASVNLSWTAPTTNEDGSPLTDLAGYKLYNGTATGVYTQTVDVGNVLSYSWDIGDVESTTIYFNVIAYDTSGNDSVYNGEVFVPFGANPPDPPTNLTVNP